MAVKGVFVVSDKQIQAVEKKVATAMKAAQTAAQAAFDISAAFAELTGKNITPEQSDAPPVEEGEAILAQAEEEISAKNKSPKGKKGAKAQKVSKGNGRAHQQEASEEL